MTLLRAVESFTSAQLQKWSGCVIFEKILMAEEENVEQPDDPERMADVAGGH